MDMCEIASADHGQRQMMRDIERRVMEIVAGASTPLSISEIVAIGCAVSKEKPRAFQRAAIRLLDSGDLHLRDDLTVVQEAR